jgi:hypothetical protein
MAAEPIRSITQGSLSDAQPAERPQERSQNRRRREGGQGLVEFALVAPVFFLLIFAVIDFGLGLRAWITVTQSAREAARIGAVGASCDAIVDKAVDSSAGLLTSPDVTVVGCQGPAGDSVNVNVSYNYDFVTPIGSLLDLISGGSIPGAITMQSSTDMRLE